MSTDPHRGHALFPTVPISGISRIRRRICQGWHCQVDQRRAVHGSLGSMDFPSWPKLKAYVDSFDQIEQLKQAIDTNDVARVRNLMTRNPELHRAPLGYHKHGPLTWVAECRVPWEPPSPARLAMATWMIDNGSDVHQGGDVPLMKPRSIAPHPDDGSARVVRCGCECRVQRRLPDYLCAV